MNLSLGAEAKAQHGEARNETMELFPRALGSAPNPLIQGIRRKQHLDLIRFNSQ
jgi:hypothetical protein